MLRPSGMENGGKKSAISVLAGRKNTGLCNGVSRWCFLFLLRSFFFLLSLSLSLSFFVFTETKCVAKRLLRFRARDCSSLDVIGDWSKIHFYEISDCRYFPPSHIYNIPKIKQDAAHLIKKIIEITRHVCNINAVPFI